MSSKQRKFIVVTGGVLSGLGKGVAAASVGALLSSRLKVLPIKCDGYLNTDPGSMNPIEHGEVYVLDDGGEVDMDFGHYERFLGVQAKSKWSLTMGKIFQEILERESRGEYAGRTIQFVPHVVDLIRSKFSEIADEEGAEVVLIEVGGTVGDLENQFYLEAVRQLVHDVGRSNVMYVHLTYVPIPNGVGEQKSKPSQMSVRDLNEKGIYPDLVIGRCNEFLSDSIKRKIASFANLSPSRVISGVDVSNVYEIPLIYAKEGVPEIANEVLRLYAPPQMGEWERLVESINRNLETPRKVLEIAICGEHLALEDSYASVVESLLHAAAHCDLKIDIRWVDTEKIDQTTDLSKLFSGIDGVVLPSDYATKGIDGKIAVVQYAREKKIPFLGICHGMQMAVVEYARHVCGLREANSAEMREVGVDVSVPVVEEVREACRIKDGVPMRLGGHDLLLKSGSLLEQVYSNSQVRERFRHRYEVNPEYVKALEDKGLIFSGRLAEIDLKGAIELEDHPFFVGVQFHPELASTLLRPAPLFLGLVRAAEVRSEST